MDLISKDIYDIIIEDEIRKQENLMSSGIGSIQWSIPKYSKKQIDKAGKILSNPDSSQQSREKALEVLNNWRSSHAYPLNIITNNLRRNTPNAIVVQRLKRLDSIENKLKRFPEMSLYRMQDLGGCRVIVDSIEGVYASLNRYKRSKIRHILKRENDYIQNPKESGYRSYHMVYQFQSDDNDTYNKNILIEIQFRTHLQHIWATALETMGIYTKSALKASQGDENILRFFTLVSSIFAIYENSPVCPNTLNNYEELISELKKVDNDINILSKLKMFSAMFKFNEQTPVVNNKGYYVLIYNLKENLLKMRGFTSSQIDSATNIYNKLESLNDENIDVVLISASSFKDLKLAYPNYFININQFIKIMEEILK